MNRGESNGQWRARARAGGDLIYGMHPVLEAVDAGREIERIYLRSGLESDYVRTLLRTCHQRGIPVQRVPSAWFGRFGSRNHQGAVAYLSPIAYQPLSQLVPLLFEQGLDPWLVVLDGVTDVHNLGAIARTASCAGVHSLVLPWRGSAQVGPDAVKCSAGALGHINVCREESLPEALRFLKESGIQLVAASEHAGITYHQADLTGPCALIMGDEGSGLSASTRELVDVTLRIPSHGPIESLNVAVAAGVLLYEMERQRHETRP